MSRARWFAVLLVALVIIAYYPATQGGFIWDDDQYVQHNPPLKNAQGLARIWIEPGATPQYYPLVFTTFWLELRLWGLWPGGYHWVNVLLHAAGALLLWRVLCRLSVPGAWLAAGIFALHPVQVESVAWITERKNVLAGVFFFASLLAYLRFDPLAEDATRPSGAKKWYVLSLGLFVCALLSKTITCSLPAVVLLLVWWKRGRLARRDVLATLPFFMLGLGMAAVTVHVEKLHVGAEGDEWNLSFVERCLIAGRALWFYAAKLIFPFDLTFIYPRWDIDAGQLWQYLFPAAFLAVLAALWIGRRRLGRGPLVAILFFAGNLLPALGFFDIYPMLYSFVADHFQYIASVGLIVLAAACLTRLASTFAAHLRPILGGALLAGLGMLTFTQGHIYRDLETLWKDTIAKNPQCWMAHLNLGAMYIEHASRPIAPQKLQEGVLHLRRAIDIRPQTAQAYNSWGQALGVLGDFDQAEEKFTRAVELSQGKHAEYLFNLGLIHLQREETDKAIHFLHAATVAQDNFNRAHLMLGQLYLQRGKADKADYHLKKAGAR